jgi:methylglutaconyl-CoA hydratase
MSYQTLEVFAEGPVAQVWINRPDLRNAFNEMVIAELTRAFTELGTNDEVRAIVLGGRGKVFCAGADLNWMKAMAGYTREQNRADALGLATMLKVMHDCPKPTIARIHGPCFAGGMGLAAVCDFAFAAQSAEFCLSEVKLGLIPATIGPYVVQAMGARAAQRYFLSAEKFSAAEAYRIGFIHEICPDEELDDTIDALLGLLVDNSPNAVRAAKRLVHDLTDAPLTDALIADTAERIADIRASDEGREGVKSFLEKRKPSWVIPEPTPDES